MSARDRAARDAKQRDEQFTLAAKLGLKEALNDPNGRAFIWMFYAGNAEAEGPGSKGRRAAARELMIAARIANWPGVQIMREEHEAPRAGRQEEAGEDEE